jgi:hypothetical protein
MAMVRVWSNRCYTAFSPYISFMGSLYEPGYALCPEEFLRVMGQSMESAKAAFGRGACGGLNKFKGNLFG